MTRTDLLLGRYSTVAMVTPCGVGEVVCAEGGGMVPALMILGEDPRDLEREAEILTRLAGSGIPVAHRTSGGGPLRLELPADVRPLHDLRDLPSATLRAGLVRLLGVVARAHSRGVAHGRISRASVLADPSGGFWLVDWGHALALDDESAAPSREIDPVQQDLHALGVTFALALTRTPWSGIAPEADPDAAAIEALSEVRDFRRVLSRLLTVDVGHAFRGAGDVLAALGRPDTSDPWRSTPFVGSDASLQRILALLEHSAHSAVRDDEHVAFVELVGPHGSGRSRLLDELGHRVRATGGLVIRAACSGGGGWGALRDLAVQLVQIVGRDAPACAQHVAAFEDLVGTGPSVSGDRQSAMSQLLTGLVEAVFLTSPGVLVLDDSERLSPTARYVWEAIGRFVCTLNQDGAAIRVVPVTGASAATTPEPGAPAESIEVEEWSAATIADLLRHVLEHPSAADELAGATYRIVGGRPGDVVSYLKELERCGSLVRIGLRCRLEIAPHRLEAATAGVVEGVRSARGVLGRDAVELVDVLSVAGPAGLSRADCGRHAELSGPRLWMAGDEADRVGLLRRSGATWCIRTDAVRERLYAAVSDARRRSLHHEFLEERLEPPMPDLAAAAWHARCAADPRAEQLTDEAVTTLVAAGQLPAAIAHLAHAATTLSLTWRHANEYRHAQLLVEAGRHGEALEILRAGPCAEGREGESSGPAYVLLALVLTQAEEYEEAATLVIPDTLDDPVMRTEFRYARALARLYVSQPALAERERRLAEAELADASASVSIRMSRHEFDYLASCDSGDRRLTLRRAMTLARAARREGSNDARARSLQRVANVLRMIGRPRRAETVLSSAEALDTGAAAVASFTRYAMTVTRALLLARRSGSPVGCRAVERAARQALVTGCPRTVEMARVRRASVALTGGYVSTGDRRVVERLIREVGRMPHARLVRLCELLAGFAYWWFRPRALDRILERLDAGGNSGGRARGARFYAVQMSLLLTGDLPPSLREHSLAWRVGREGVAAWLRRASAHRSPVRRSRAPPERAELITREASSLVVALLIRGCFGDEEWPPAWTGPALQDAAIGMDSATDRSMLASAMVLSGVAEPRGRVAEIIRGLDATQIAEFPRPAQWQVLGALARIRANEGRVVAARDLRSRAISSARGLLSEDAGNEVRDAVARALRLLRLIGPRWRTLPRRRPRSAETRLERGGLVHSRGGVLRSAWEPVLAQASVSQSLIAETLHPAEAREFVRAAWGLRIPTIVNMSILESETACCVALPDLAAESDLRAALSSVDAARSRGLRTALVLASPPAEFGARSLLAAALVASGDGVRVRVPGLLDNAEARASVFQGELRRQGSESVAAPCLLAEVRAYTWPGGLGEVESVVQALAALSGGTLTAAALASTGWQHRRAALPASLTTALETEILASLRSGLPESISTIVSRVGHPRRTVQRSLRTLVSRGVVTASGRARATRYLT